jgi:AraC family ethanolamine operon transcriptional activator
MNRVVFQRGDVGSHKLALGIPIKLSGQAVLCGESSCLNGLHVFSGPSGFEFLSPENLLFIGLEISLPTATSSSEEKLLIRELQSKLQDGRRVIPLPKNLASDLRAMLSTMLVGLKANPATLNDARSLGAFKRAAAGAVLAILSHSDVRPNSSVGIVTNWQVASQARRLVEGAPDCPMSVVELALRLGVSRRTLQYACQSSLGVKPTSFLRALRLNGVRREMRNAPSVTEAATRWGFWHFGNFARDYRTMFGELPSQTLRQMNSTHAV